MHNDKVFLVIGPWSHGQMIEEGSSLGALKFPSDTSYYFRQEVLRPFLDQHLQNDAPKADIAPVIAYETGSNKWRELSGWPESATDYTIRPTPFYLNAGLKLECKAPSHTGSKYDEYISYPDKPVPYRARPSVRRPIPQASP